MTALSSEHIVDGCQDLKPAGSCVQRLAAGWIGPADLCPSCTTRFMAAVDGIDGPLQWHLSYYERAEGGGSSPWPHEELADDFVYAICGSDYTQVDTRKTGLGGQRMAALAVRDIAEVVRWHVSYHCGGRWEPGMSTGTELTLYAVLRLASGLWASVVAGNDYTGWGCQDHAEVRIGESEDEVVLFGLDAEGRSLLGYPGGAS